MRHFLNLVFFCSAGLIWGPVQAQTIQAEEPKQVLRALGLSDVIAVMRQEGLAQGADMSGALLPSGAASDWQRSLEMIYNLDRMENTVTRRFSKELGDVDMAPVLGFLTSPTGQRLVALELSAREAMMEGDIEQAARAAFRALDEKSDARLTVLNDFVRANDLVEANVTSALNANYAYYRGLHKSGALGMSDQQMLEQVWSGEAEARIDINEWVFAFLLMAYTPLGEDVVAEYAALSQTEAGKRMNRALFAGFDEMFRDISFALGMATGRILQTQEL